MLFLSLLSHHVSFVVGSELAQVVMTPKQKEQQRQLELPTATDEAAPF